MRSSPGRRRPGGTSSRTPSPARSRRRAARASRGRWSSAVGGEAVVEDAQRLLPLPEAVPRGLRLRRLIEGLLEAERRARREGEGAGVEPGPVAGHAALEAGAAAAVGGDRERRAGEAGDG